MGRKDWEDYARIKQGAASMPLDQMLTQLTQLSIDTACHTYHRNMSDGRTIICHNERAEHRFTQIMLKNPRGLSSTTSGAEASPGQYVRQLEVQLTTLRTDNESLRQGNEHLPSDVTNLQEQVASWSLLVEENAHLRQELQSHGAAAQNEATQLRQQLTQAVT